MIELSVILALYVVGSLIYMDRQRKEAKEERAELELALIAVTKPTAAITKKGLEDPEPAVVRYEGEGESYNWEE